MFCEIDFAASRKAFIRKGGESAEKTEMTAASGKTDLFLPFRLLRSFPSFPHSLLHFSCVISLALAYLISQLKNEPASKPHGGKLCTLSREKNEIGPCCLTCWR